MTLTTVLLLLKLMTIAVVPGDLAEKDDTALAACAIKELTAKPSDLRIVAMTESPDATFTISNESGVRIHVVGTLVARNGAPFIDVNHVTHGLNHTLCNQAKGLLDEMAKKITGSAPVVVKALESSPAK